MSFIYNILLWLAFPIIALYYGLKMMLTGKHRKGFGQRFGFLSAEAIAGMKGSPRIWVHAVSVGEVTAAAPIIASLREQLPAACIVLSTTTETGQEMARRIVTAANAFIYYPLDISFVVRRSIDAVRPDIFVLTETELWPNFLWYCRKRGVRVFMANGRLSPRSFRKYKLTRFFWKGLLIALDGVGAITAVDAERFRLLGAPPDRLHVAGNAKYDSLAAKASSSLKEETGRRLNIAEGYVLVAGSTHPGEEEIIFQVYGELLNAYPDFKLIIVPRHIERASAVLALAREAGFEGIITMTEIAGGRKRRDERIIVIDSIGELFKVYSLATVVFCGGSLVPRGGQNIVEAAAWGKVIFYGPFMDDFPEERNLLESVGAGITVKGGGELLAGILKIISDPATLVSRGEEGRRVVVANTGASGRYAEYIRNLLPREKGDVVNAQ